MSKGHCNPVPRKQEYLAFQQQTGNHVSALNMLRTPGLSILLSALRFLCMRSLCHNLHCACGVSAPVSGRERMLLCPAVQPARDTPVSPMTGAQTAGSCVQTSGISHTGGGR